jgi:hypothetical protein
MTQRSRRRAPPRSRRPSRVVVLGGCSRVVRVADRAAAVPRRTRRPYDTTWRALVRALAVEDVPLRVVAKDSGVISSDDFISPIGVYADCGRIGEALLEGEALVAFTLFVQPGRDGATLIQVNSKMRTHAYRRGSSGKLKTDRVFECVSDRTAGGRPRGSSVAWSG